jgi:hypothetical protein
MKYLYKYPQPNYSCEEPREEKRRRTSLELEYELVETAAFDQALFRYRRRIEKIRKPWSNGASVQSTA